MHRILPAVIPHRLASVEFVDAGRHHVPLQTDRQVLFACGQFCLRLPMGGAIASDIAGGFCRVYKKGARPTISPPIYRNCAGCVMSPLSHLTRNRSPRSRFAAVRTGMCEAGLWPESSLFYRPDKTRPSTASSFLKSKAL